MIMSFKSGYLVIEIWKIALILIVVFTEAKPSYYEKEHFISACFFLQVFGFFQAKVQVNAVSADIDWSSQQVILTNSVEADFIIRIGDIDNLGFGSDRPLPQMTPMMVVQKTDGLKCG